MNVNIICDDCMHWLKSCDNGYFDLIVTDPPYNVETNGGGLYKLHSKRYVKELREIDNGYSSIVLDELVRVMKKINIYLFCNQKQIKQLLDYFLNLDRVVNWNLLSWHKTNPVPACSNKYLNDTEYIMFFREKGVKVRGNYETKKTHYETPLNKQDKNMYHHPTIKPLSIVENLVVNSSDEGDRVLDPFMGTGTTEVACMKLNRDFTGIEINAEYFNTAKQRLSSVSVQQSLF